MNKQKENSNFLLERLTMIGLFVFIVFVFKSTDCTHTASFSQPTAIEHVLKFDKSAILVSQISYLNSTSVLVACEIFTPNTCNLNKVKVICSSSKANQLLKNCRLTFVEIKPCIFYCSSCCIRTSLTNEDIPSIS